MSEQATGFWLSPQQKLGWKLTSEVLHADSRAICRISIHGKVDVDRMRSSLRQIVSRHESLRTVFRRQPGMKVPFQVVLESQEPAWEEIDLSGRSKAERGIEIDLLLTSEKQVAADAEQSTVVRAFLVREEPSKYSLVLSFSSLCADAHSLPAIFRELCALYSGQSDLPDPFRYVQFAQWQLDLLESEDDDARKARTFWEKITSAIAPILLPEEKQAGGVFTPDQVCVELDANSAAEVLRAPEPNLLLSAWAAVVARVSQQNSLLLHVEAPGREFEELENAVGSFARMLPLSIPVESHFSFADVSRRTSESLQEAIGVQEFLPLDRVDHDGVSFAYYDLGKTEQAGGAQFQLDRLQIIAERFKLRLVVVRRGPRVGLEFHYDGARLDRAVVERIAGWYQNLLVAGLANAEAKVSELPLLSEAERQQVLVEWNNTAAEYPAAKCLHQLFEVQAERTPERVAVRCGERAFTYQQLNARANQLAHYLRRQGVGPDKLVGLCLERSAETMVAVLAILKAGGAYVPLNPDNPPARLRQQMEGAVVVLTQSKLSSQVPEFPGAKLVLDGEPKPWTGEPTSNPSCTTTPENLVYVLYTSGSTGVPKGVAVRHRNLVNYADFIGKRLGAEKHSEGLQFATVSTLGADLGNTCIYPSLITGGTLHVIGYETATDGVRFGEYAAKYGIDVLKIVPSHMAALLQTQSDAEQAKKLLPRKYLVFGGETLTAKLLEKIAALGSSCEVLNHYGPTETTVGSLTLTLQGYGWKSNRLSSIPIGRPIQNTQVYVLDQNLQPVPVGVRGELYIAGAGVTAGYLNQAEKTAERFIENPYSSEGSAKMYRTGDLARYLEGGEIEFLGRGDDQVKVRGFRIELGEIEAALARHTGVKQALVLARENEQGDKRLMGYAVVQGSNVTGEQLRDYLKQEVPDYMVPQAIAVLAKFPLTPNGKIDRQALPEPQAAQRAHITAPRDEKEAALTKIWRKVLHNEAIGVTDNFFDVGGHSLLAVQLMAAIAKETGHEVPLTALFRAPTVESMAKLLRDGNEPQPDPIVMPVQAGDGVPFFAVASPGTTALGYVALAKAMGSTQAVYKLQSRRRVAPPNSPITLTDMRSLALAYIEGMRSVQPSGPYYLGGMCAGAHIAEQMILELEAQGETVGLFAVFDTWVLQNAYVRWLWRLHYYQQRTRQLLRSGGRRRFKSLTRSLHRTVDRIIHPFSLPPETPWQKVYWPGKDFSNPRFDAPVALFKRPRQPFYYVKDATLGWGSRSRGGVEIHCIDVPHSMLRLPYVRQLASLLRESLSRATSNGPHRDRIWRILDDNVAPKTIDVQT
ncbi:MAG TPA: amino acid adenylation domain-containing protein [Terriglobales bacterium]|nr:amino acid adenylation domain-containing protein [Terriglobales bacterium]